MQVAERTPVVALLDDVTERVGVECVADRLHLRQDQPPLRSLDIDRNDQDDRVPGLHEVAEQRRRFEEVVGAPCQQRVLELRQDAFALGVAAGSRYAERFEAGRLPELCDEFRRGFGEIGFVDDRNQADFAVAGGFEQPFFGLAPYAGFGHEQDHVGTVEGAPGTLDPAVVVPGTGDVIATSCPEIRFRKLDLPEFVRPATTI